MLLPIFPLSHVYFLHVLIVVVHSAAEYAARGGKKTVMPKDVFDALQELEFEGMLQRVEAEVQKFTSIQADKRNTYRKKVRDGKKAQQDKVGNENEDESPPAKRARREEGPEGDDDDDADETVEGEEQDDEEVEDDEVEEEGPDEEPTEDLLEEREKEAEEDEMVDGDESD